MTSTHPKLLASLSFDDVLLRPRQSDLLTRTSVNLGCDLACNKSGRSLYLHVPLIASPMDTVCEENMAIHMALAGGLGIIHRFMSIDDQVRQVAAVKRYVNYVFRDPYTVKIDDTVADILTKRDMLGISTFCVLDIDNIFCGLITDRDLSSCVTDNNYATDIMTSVGDIYGIYLSVDEFGEYIADITGDKFETFMTRALDIMNTHRVDKVPVLNSNSHSLLGLITKRCVQYYFNNRKTAALDNHGRLRVGAAIGIRDGYLDHARRLIDAGVDLICVDVANGHNIHTITAVKSLRENFPELVIMAGNVCTGQGAIDLAMAGADCIRIGIGNGSICSTRLETGVGFGQWSAVNECYDALCGVNSGVKLVCDGGSLGKTGNKMKAIASGAVAVMLGRTLASCDESPGQVIIRNGKRMKYFRGMASTMANLSNQERATKRAKLDTKFTAEGVDGVIELKGSVYDLISQITGGLRSGFSYLGVITLDALHELRKSGAIEWGQSTAIGMSETGIRVQTL